MPSLSFLKDRLTALALLGIFVSAWTLSPRSQLSSAPLLLAAKGNGPAVAELPRDLGRLEPKGRTNPDGSEVWGYPEGSGLEDRIEVHVKDGRVVREVLRPSSRISAQAFAE